MPPFSDYGLRFFTSPTLFSVIILKHVLSVNDYGTENRVRFKANLRRNQRKVNEKLFLQELDILLCKCAFFLGGLVPDTWSTFFQWFRFSLVRVQISWEWLQLIILIGLNMFLIDKTSPKPLKKGATFYAWWSAAVGYHFQQNFFDHREVFWRNLCDEVCD